MTLRHIVITGPPGVGKTTLVQKIVEQLEEKKTVNYKGFYTSELREYGQRTGFEVVNVKNRNERAMLANVNGPENGPTVGKYKVNVGAFEAMALQLLTATMPKMLIVVDEIGKMEMFSERFCDQIQNILNNSNVFVLATIPIAKGRPIPLVERIRNGPNTALFNISKNNRDHIIDDIVKLILEIEIAL